MNNGTPERRLTLDRFFTYRIAVSGRLEGGLTDWSGKRLEIADQKFTVSGIFEAPGTLYENWIIGFPSELQVVLGRRDYSFARMRLRPGVDVMTRFGTNQAGL